MSSFEKLEFLGSGALNLDIIYEIEDMALVRRSGFDLHPGREISGSHREAEKLVDFLESHGTLRTRSGGGSSANTICCLSLLGHRTGFAGVTGEDQAGGFVLEDMAEVDCSMVKKRGKTAVCIVVMEKTGQDRAMFVAPHSMEMCFADPEVVERVGDTEVLHLSSLVHTRGLNSQGKLVDALRPDQFLSFDPGELYAARGLRALSGILKRTDVLFITEQETEMLFPGLSWEQGLKELYPLINRNRTEDRGCRCLVNEIFREAGGPLIICKRGRRGVSAFTPALSFSCPAERVSRIVDNTGAGDAFNAGFLHAASSGRPIAECMKAGVRTAAMSLSGFGREWMEGLTEKRF